MATKTYRVNNRDITLTYHPNGYNGGNPKSACKVTSTLSTGRELGEVIAEAVEHARQVLDAAVATLANVGWDATHDILKRWFHCSMWVSSGQITTIRNKLTAIRDGLAGDVGVEDYAHRTGAEGEAPSTRLLNQIDQIRHDVAEQGQQEAVFTFQKTLTHADFDDIQFNFDQVLVCSKSWGARVIIHEASHKYGQTVDWAYNYKSNNPEENLSTPKALENADTYAYTAVSIHAGQVLDVNNVSNGTGFLTDPELRGYMGL